MTNMAREWTFGQRMGAGFALVVVLTFVMGAVGYVALKRVAASKDLVIRHTSENLIDAQALRAAMQLEVASVRGFLLTADQRYVDGIELANEEFASTLGRIRARGLTQKTAELIAHIATAEAAHQSDVDRILSRRRAHEDVAAIVETFEREMIPAKDRLAKTIRTFVAASKQQQESERQEALRTTTRATYVLLAVALGTLLLAGAIAFLLTRTLSRQIATSVQYIRSSSAELQASATQQASGAKEQATAMTEIGTTIGELLASSRQIAKSGQLVAKMAADSASSARTGNEAVSTARDAVSSIKEQVDTIVRHILELGQKSQQIGGILEIINELAEQTNILAINATIEAAGAGDAGRRFAVVGEEIRKLADRVGGSTKEIRTLIDEIRSAVNSTVMATETGSKTVEAGAQRFKELQTAFSRIGDIVTSTMEAGREIELSTKQQSTAVEQVNSAISNVSQATRETAASSSQTLQTASQLASLSDDLVKLVQAN